MQVSVREAQCVSAMVYINGLDSVEGIQVHVAHSLDMDFHSCWMKEYNVTFDTVALLKIICSPIRLVLFRFH